MIELILLGVILILCGLLGWEKRENRLERSKFINALLAKSASDMATMDLGDKTQIKVEKPKESPLEFVSPDGLSQEDWEKVVTNG